MAQGVSKSNIEFKMCRWGGGGVNKNEFGGGVTPQKS